MKTRRLTPEILDELPADNPEAIRSRRDLRLINSLMGNYRMIRRAILAQSEMTHWVELGAGAGSLADSFDSESRQKFKVCGVDLGPRPENWPNHWNWYQGDLFAFLEGEKKDSGSPECRGVIANLFLHHFSDDQLIRLGKILRQNYSRILAVEPVRRRRHCRMGALLHPFVNRVTRHDMRVSIEAGFRGGELAAILIGGDDEWDFRLRETWIGSHFLSAERRTGL